MAKCVIAISADAPSHYPEPRVAAVLAEHAKDWTLVVVVADPDSRWRRELYFERRVSATLKAEYGPVAFTEAEHYEHHDWDYLDDAGNGWCKRCGACWPPDAPQPADDCTE